MSNEKKWIIKEMGLTLYSTGKFKDRKAAEKEAKKAYEKLYDQLKPKTNSDKITQNINKNNNDLDVWSFIYIK